MLFQEAMKIPVLGRPGVERGFYLAYCPDLLGCSAAARSEEEALRLLRERIREYFKESRDDPVPPGTRRVEVEL